MSQWLNCRSWRGDIPATVAMFCAVWAFGAPTAVADPDGIAAAGSGAASSAPANAGLELNPVAQASMPGADAGRPDQPAAEDPPPAMREDIAIRRIGRTQEAGAATLPWYRGGLASLGLVLGVITVVALVLKRVAKTSRGGGGGVLQVLTRTHLSPKQSIAVVQMGGRLVFVGITPEQISTLRVVEDREEAALLRGQLRIGAAPFGETVFDKHLSREAKELAEGWDTGVEANCGMPNTQSEAKDDLKGLLDRLRNFQRGQKPSAISHQLGKS